MGTKEKLLKRLFSEPSDFTFGELQTLLISLGYELKNSGRTSGSAVRFVNNINGHIIRIHKPHPGNILKMYAVRYIAEELRKAGFNEK